VAIERNSFVGAAGEHFVASQFLQRGYNVALPILDHGTDIFVVLEDDGYSQRVQVKTSVRFWKSNEKNTLSIELRVSHLREALNDFEGNQPIIFAFFFPHHEELGKHLLLVIPAVTIASYLRDTITTLESNVKKYSIKVYIDNENLIVIGDENYNNKLKLNDYNYQFEPHFRNQLDLIENA
jgi:hypothetical protein